MYFSSREKQKGFTLIELLVVVAIIGILSSVILVSLSSARSKARDSKRVQDMKQIELALDMYLDDYGSYPADDGDGCGGWDVGSQDVDLFSNGLLDNYIPTRFKDPWATGTCNGYRYNYYSTDTHGCSAPFYILGFTNSQYNGYDSFPNSPGCSCYDNTDGTLNTFVWLMCKSE